MLPIPRKQRDAKGLRLVSYFNKLNIYFNYYFFLLQFIIYYAAYIAADSDAPGKAWSFLGNFYVSACLLYFIASFK